jgi:hypothetical protein
MLATVLVATKSIVVCVDAHFIFSLRMARRPALADRGAAGASKALPPFVPALPLPPPAHAFDDSIAFDDLDIAPPPRAALGTSEHQVLLDDMGFDDDDDDEDEDGAAFHENFSPPARANGDDDAALMTMTTPQRPTQAEVERPSVDASPPGFDSEDDGASDDDGERSSSSSSKPSDVDTVVADITPSAAADRADSIALDADTTDGAHDAAAAADSGALAGAASASWDVVDLPERPQYTTDDILPMLIYIVACCNVPGLLVASKFIEAAGDVMESTERMFYYTLFSSAVQFVADAEDAEEELDAAGEAAFDRAAADAAAAGRTPVARGLHGVAHSPFSVCRVKVLQQ